jgi:hypothetical protein
VKNAKSNTVQQPIFLTHSKPNIMPAKDLLDASDDEISFTINDKFAKRYEEKKQNEELTHRRCPTPRVLHTLPFY